MALNVLYSVFLGVVQGISEWLPISSKTQVLLASNLLFGLPAAVGLAFGLFMEVGSLGSAVIYFWRTIWRLLSDMKLLTYLVVVTVVTAVEGVPLYLLSEHLLANAYNIGLPVVVLGLFLLLDALYIRYTRMKPRIGGLKDMGTKHYLIIGVAQGLAALPGVSRSGMTVSTMLFLGVDPEDAFKLSFLAYIPASLGGFATTLLFTRSDVNQALSVVDPTGVAIAIVAAALVGLGTISVLLRFAKRSDIYKVTLALGVITLTIGALATVGSL